MANVLLMENMRKAYPGVVALFSATLEARGGEVHALMGANGAGKSTLMSILGGVTAPDAGEISIDGEPLDIRSPLDSASHGIAFVQQELNMLPAMSVAENICISNLPGKRWAIDKAEIARRCQPILDQLGCRFSLSETVEALSTGDQQMVEIARALMRSPRVVIFDEPTSSLTDRERRRLFQTIAQLREAGTIIIYITHFIEEIFEICDRVTVMRNGATVRSGLIGEFTQADIVRLMVGEKNEPASVDKPRSFSRPTGVAGQTLLEVRGLGRAGALTDISFDIRAGEIVGIWGLLGAGRTELLRALTGLDPIDTGVIRLRTDKDRELEIVSPARLHNYAAFVTEDRRGEGLFLPLSVERNLAFPSLRNLLRFGAIDGRREASLAKGMINKLSIKVSSPKQTVATLSGGNQQKVVIGRWLATRPKLFLLDEPTRGVDVAAKAEILRLAREIASSGVPVIIVCSELDEIQRISDRFLLMNRGRIVSELPGGTSKEALMAGLSENNGGRTIVN
ncbi:sugar ABC transporter ATP-binding protein [Rhizobium sp. CF142]|uniref:sugar ABC transporter ATP-binding protein n=1 Tax=Rhizobium sp. CF142 TaxID=1144314 RepID=UPI00026EEB06|nr:sugar ABC transporter ATP-binding protein [Rhizobium sp. CF142]EJJ31518.1 ABC-type sugar transport system, ATPase component [Rhizobium sp. CF142]